MISEPVVIALIGAAGVIIAAIIGLAKKEKTKETIKIKQEVNKEGATAIGIQNNYGRDDKKA